MKKEEQFNIRYGCISGKPRKISLEEKKILHDYGVAAVNKFFAEAIGAN